MLKAIVNKTIILNPLSKIQTVVDKKTTMQLLNNVLICVEDEKLILEASDLEISYKGLFEAIIEDQGEITVNARRFYEIVREIPTELFKIEQLPQNWLKITFGDKGEFKLGGLPADNFPRFIFLDKKFHLECDFNDLRTMLKMTSFAVSNDESKYALSGLLLETDKDKSLIRAVGSNSHRLSLKEIRLSGSGITDDVSIIIPKKAVMEMIRFLEVEDNDQVQKATLYSDDKFLHLSTGNEHLNLRLMDGIYPDYKLILSLEKERFLYFDRLNMLNVLKRVSLIDPDPEIKTVKITFSGDNALVESISKESSDAREMLPVEYSGDDFNMAINARYMIETLSVMKSDRVRFTINDDESPCIIEGDGDPGFLALIMPISMDE